VGQNKVPPKKEMVETHRKVHQPGNNDLFILTGDDNNGNFSRISPQTRIGKHL
jgi:hypothetical protein